MLESTLKLIELENECITVQAVAIVLTIYELHFAISRSIIGFFHNIIVVNAQKFEAPEIDLWIIIDRTIQVQTIIMQN